MKKQFLFLFLITSFFGFSQEDAWVYFNDKPNAQFYFDNPLEMLSQRSLDRRTSQNIALDIIDVPISQEYIDAVTAIEGIEVKARSKWMNCLHIRGSVEVINSLTSLPFVQRVYFANRSLNSGGRISNNRIKPLAKKFDIQENFNYGDSSNQIQMLNGHLLHQQNFTGQGKIIAIMDAGFPGVNVVSPFQRLRNNNQILGGYNFVDKDENIYTRNSHGTLVLSTMGGFVDNQLVGTAPDASYYLFITEDINSENPVEESNWVEAAELADKLGVDVINTSLGYFGYDNPNYSYTYEDIDGETAFISKGADIAFSRGMICVTSAGNSGGNIEPHISVPADSFKTLAVGAVDANEVYADFSSIGYSFDGRVKPDVMAQGRASVVSSTTGNIVTASGTSFSGPITAGMVTSFWQAIPWATNQQVIDFVRSSADRFLTPDEFHGYGIPDFQAALDIAMLSIEGTNNARFLVYPNPFRNEFTISFPNINDEVNISLTNVFGQKVVEKQISNSQSISVENIQAGIYFYKISGNGINQSGKIIKE